MQNGRMTMRVLCLRLMAAAFDISLASGPLQDTRDGGKDLFAFLDAEVFDEFYLLFPIRSHSEQTWDIDRSHQASVTTELG